MKSLITAGLLLTTFASFAADDFIVNSEVINKSGKSVVVAIATDYEAQSSNPFCKTYGLPDGEASADKKTEQRVYFLNENETSKIIPDVYGVCKYTLRSVGVRVFSKDIITNLKKMEGTKEVGDGVFVYRGTIGSSDVQVKEGKAPLNAVKCKNHPTNPLTFDCDKSINEIFTDGSVLNLKFELSK